MHNRSSMENLKDGYDRLNGYQHCNACGNTVSNSKPLSADYVTLINSLSAWNRRVDSAGHDSTCRFASEGVKTQNPPDQAG